MVKFRRRDKQLKDFESMLDEIRDFQNDHSEDEISAENLEYEVFSESMESSEEERTSSTEDIEFVPGSTFKIVGGRTQSLELNEDFPLDSEDNNLQYTAEQLERMTIVDRKEYRDNKNILNPNKKKSSVLRRCKNIDD